MVQTFNLTCHYGTQHNTTKTGRYIMVNDHERNTKKTKQPTLTINDIRDMGLTCRLQGKEFIKYDGLVVMAHSHGLQSIDTTIEHQDFETGRFIFSAIVSGLRGTFKAHGDSTVRNVSKMILPHMIRMAETRAVARALRSYTAVGMCSLEELGGDND